MGLHFSSIVEGDLRLLNRGACIKSSCKKSTQGEKRPITFPSIASFKTPERELMRIYVAGASDLSGGGIEYV
jgi:hypothetical protein